MSDINLGPFRINPRGELDPNKKYKFLDLVSYKGSTYLNINNDIIDGAASIGELPTDIESSTKYYMLIASKGDKGDIADRYDSFINLTDNTWDYSVSDKIKLSNDYNEEQTLNITNVYDGCCGIIITNKDIQLPINSDLSIDFYYTSLLNNDQYYIYTFLYNESMNKFIWNRSVYINE